jgi:hypothetical protein
MNNNSSSIAKPRVVVYTCTFPDYDQVFDPHVVDYGFDYIIFSNENFFSGTVWQWRNIPDAINGQSKFFINRFCKIFSHLVLPEYQYSIYIDGNIRIIDSILPLFNDFVKSNADIALFKHWCHQSISQELDACFEAGKIDGNAHAVGLMQINRYHAEGLPAQHTLTENGIIFRRHGSPVLDVAMETWWEELRRNVHRDQISLPFVLNKSHLSVKYWDWNYRDANPFFMVCWHLNNRFHNILDYLAFISKKKDRWQWLRIFSYNIFHIFIYNPRLQYHKIKALFYFR